MSIAVSTLGFPRIGPRRELKNAVEHFWAGELTEEELLKTAAQLRADTWALQSAAGVTHIPSNDFSFYDHMLDTSVMVGAIPAGYGWTSGPVSLQTYFALARGNNSMGAMEMTKWFDTNYHYLVPEFTPGQKFTLASTKPLDEFLEAKGLGYHTRPVLVGPVTYLLLGKGKTADPLALLPNLLPVYGEMLRKLADAGADWVQIDEPYLVMDIDARTREAYQTAYKELAAASKAKLMLTTYFGALGDNLSIALSLPVAGLHIDLLRAPEQLATVVAQAPKDLVLSLGVVDGRNVWRTDLNAVLDRVEPIVAQRGQDKVVLGPSCSMLHVPISLDLEAHLDPDLKTWLAFATQKVGELSVLARALNDGRASVKDALDASAQAVATRKTSPKIHNKAVLDRAAAVDKKMTERKSPFPERRRKQQQRFGLPAFPTTSIGSFPQTAGVRKARAEHDRGRLDDAGYSAFLREEIASTVKWQEEIGIDVLVHGEFERNDMVQYFGEQMAGYAFTEYAWVQSYGSRCVRPPIIFGDVSRPNPMTVEWSSYAQSLTKKPMKGMLTGPVTMLQWSFVRDDIPRSATCRQIALALRDEVTDLEKAGIKIIQIDEPALREGLPLRRAEWDAYLAWAVESFRVAASGVEDDTQIHTHMCYSEFNDIISAIGAMDADVISIESTRSKMELLDAFERYKYPNEIGPGVYDIHSPRVPDVAEMVELLGLAKQRLSADQIWVNPDCGLKTRRWTEVRPALVNMVQAAQALRSGVGAKA